MADHLPDDPREWPADPFRVLGVEPGAAEADVRRAYTRLIRRFKPEHAPEQFRRVREAYEQVLELTRWGGWTPPAFTPPSEAEPEVGPARPAAPQDAAWALAATDPPAGYSRLVELSGARPDDSGPALRLYWLLAVHPGLDPDRTRHDWLGAALTRGRLTGPAVELYRRELAADPDRGLHGPYRRLTEADAPAPAVLQVAWRRLGPAAAGRAWMVVEDDLGAAAARAGELPERDWLSYLVAVAGHAAFEPHLVSGRCLQLLGGLRHLELREGWAFDLLEERMEAARVWGEAAGVPGPVREVMRLAWAGADEWRGAVCRAAAWAADDPGAALRAFDAASGPVGNRPVLAAFARLLSGTRGEPPPYPPGLARGLAHEFLSRDPRADYGTLRPGLLAFLLAEQLDPEELCRACDVAPGLRPRSLAGHLRGDPELRLTWQTATAGGR